MIVAILLIALLSILFVFYSGYYLFGLYYGKYVPVKNEIYLPEVSIVIATYNEEAVIKEKIDNTTNLNYPKNKMELIFVDSSDDQTSKIIQEFKESSDLNILLFEEEERRGLASALNRGYELASGDVVIKADCDISLQKNSIREIVKPFRDPKIGAVSGAIEIVNQANVEIGYRNIFDRLRLAETNLDSTYLFNQFSAFRKELIEPIDTESVADDAELALKIRKRGYKTVYSPKAVAYEVSPTSIRERIRQKSRRAQGHIRLIMQNLGFLFNSRYGRFGLIIFPANCFMIILSPWLMLLTLFTLFAYASILVGPLLSLVLASVLFLSMITVYVESKPKMIAGFLDSQLNLLIGSVKLLTRGPDFKWTKDKRHDAR